MPGAPVLLRYSRTKKGEKCRFGEMVFLFEVEVV